MRENTFDPWKHFNNYNEQIFEDKSSDLPQWPIKLWKVPAVSPYFHHAHLLIAADCSAFSCPAFHDKLTRGKVTLICCPESDNDISTKLDEAGSHMAYHKVMDAVACFEQGNHMLCEVVHELGE